MKSRPAAAAAVYLLGAAVITVIWVLDIRSAGSHGLTLQRAILAVMILSLLAQGVNSLDRWKRGV
jgi:hypothetical protein